MVYKIASKVLVNHFQEVLPRCIDEAQSAFILGRLISDNIIVANELLLSMKNKKTGRKGSFTLKLNMSKAYDRVNWQFLEAIMIKLGFSRTWVNQVMSFVTSMSYLVVVNGVVGEKFSSTRVLRQGNRLGSHMFLLCEEGLSSLLRVAELSGHIRAHVVRSLMIVTHLLFADDCFIFDDAS